MSPGGPRSRPEAPRGSRSRPGGLRKAPGGSNSRPPEAENHTKMLFEITVQNFFRDRCRPDARNLFGLSGRLWGRSPTGDPAIRRRLTGTL